MYFRMSWNLVEKYKYVFITENTSYHIVSNILIN